LNTFIEHDGVVREVMSTGNNRLPELAAQIAAGHQANKRDALAIAERSIELGHWLIEAKAGVSHGQFEPWVTANCRMSLRSAQRYMRLAKLGAKSATVALLGIRAADEAVAKKLPKVSACDPKWPGRNPHSMWSKGMLAIVWPAHEHGFSRFCIIHEDGRAVENRRGVRNDYLEAVMILAGGFDLDFATNVEMIPLDKWPAIAANLGVTL
jgi:hypothetical protein